MFALSWFYQYLVGGLIYAGGTLVCVRTGVLDLSDGSERRIWLAATGCLAGYAVVHALFQFVLPFVG